MIGGRQVVPLYDPEKNRWLAAELPGSHFISGGGKRRNNLAGTSCDLGLAYDAKRDLVWGVLGNLRPGALNVLRVKREELSLVELK
jgi:hypothetical protein